MLVTPGSERVKEKIPRTPRELTGVIIILLFVIIIIIVVNFKENP